MTIPQTENHTVLVVDDEMHIRLLIERCLRRAGLRVRTATSGEEAIGLFERDGADLLILDYEMPGANGVETLRRIRGMDGGGRIPAIMLTARGQSDYEAQAGALGVSSFFGKPFSPSGLVRAVKSLLTQPT